MVIHSPIFSGSIIQDRNNAYADLSGSFTGSLSGSAGSPGGANNGCGSTNGENGENGGDGGDWGSFGPNTENTGNGGSAGKAINGSNYVISGLIDSSTLKGLYIPQ